MNQHIDKVIATVSSGSAAARSRLGASWHRSFHYHGLDPSHGSAAPEADTARLKESRGRLDHVLTIAEPKLDDLYLMIGHCGCGVFLTDADGLLLDGRFNAADQRAFAGWGLAPGMDWSEAAQGTNGIGTCVVEKRAVTIHRDQHFLAQNTVMSCIDAPIFGPDGGLIAALDVSSARVAQTEGMNQLISAMVIRVAAQIETDLFREAHSSHRIVLAGHDTTGAALLAVDRDDIVVGATREARRRFELEATGRIRPTPLRDLTGEDAQGLAGAERAVVIRALTRAKGNVSEAARSLGLGRATLYRRMKRLGIDDRS